MRILLLSVLAVTIIGVMIPSAFAETYTNEDMRFSIELPDEMKIKYFPAQDDFQVPFVEISGYEGFFYDDFRIEIYYWGHEVYYSDYSESFQLDLISGIEKEVFKKTCDDAYIMAKELPVDENVFEYERSIRFDYCDFLKQEFAFPNPDITIFEFEWFEVGPLTYSETTDREYYPQQRGRLYEMHVDNEKWEIQPEDGVWGLYFHSGNKEMYNSIVRSFTTFEDNDIRERDRGKDGGITCLASQKPVSIINKYGTSEMRCAGDNWSEGDNIPPHSFDVYFRESKTTSSISEPYPEPEPEPQALCSDGTVWKDGQCVLDERGGGCLIATAAFGSEIAPQVQFLREVRDNTVLQTQSGTAFMTGFNQFYYSFSPAIADYERENPVFKEAVKVSLTPLLTSLTLLNYVDVDTEEEMLGYGIGIIVLNVGMYFVAPAILVISIKNRLKK